MLFLDELGEVPPRLLDALRQPLEDGTVTVSRRRRTVTFPAVLQLVVATNPCPSGDLTIAKLLDSRAANYGLG